MQADWNGEYFKIIQGEQKIIFHKTGDTLPFGNILGLDGVWITESLNISTAASAGHTAQHDKTKGLFTKKFLITKFYITTKTSS